MERKIIINEELLMATVAEVSKVSPQQWMLSVGLTWEAERYLRDSASASNVMGSGPDTIRMVGFQLGFELARKLAKAGELL